jgi:hypothetical protein
MTARLDDRAGGEVLRVVGLQVRRDQTHALLEYLQRHSGLDPRALDASAGCHTVIAIEGAQQRGLTGTVLTMHHPAIATMNRQ